MPLIISLGFSFVQATEINSSEIFFPIDYIQLIDTFTVCLYAAIIPARIVLFVENSNIPKIYHFLLWFIGAGLYIFSSFSKTPLNIIILLISLVLAIVSYYILHNYLTKGVSNGNTKK